MKQALPAFAAGALFAVGLTMSGMTQTAKVIGFLDVFGNWDSTLALVMVAAIGVYAPLRLLILKAPKPLTGKHFAAPTRNRIDWRLLSGAALFGIGWGTAGYCPGPGIVAVSTGTASALVFVVTMALGSWVTGRFDNVTISKS
jgi:uncharacterized protein